MAQVAKNRNKKNSIGPKVAQRTRLFNPLLVFWCDDDVTDKMVLRTQGDWGMVQGKRFGSTCFKEPSLCGSEPLPSPARITRAMETLLALMASNSCLWVPETWPGEAQSCRHLVTC